MKKLFASAALAVSLLAIAPAQAQSADTAARSANVAYGDLNLQTESGLATFRGRVKAAANRLCGRTAVVPLAEALEAAKCHTQLISDAEQQVKLADAVPQARIAAVR